MHTNNLSLRRKPSLASRIIPMPALETPTNPGDNESDEILTKWI